MNKTEARRLARAKQAQVRADREEAQRRAREEAERVQRERDLANENDLVEFFQIDAGLDEAARVYEKAKADLTRRQNEVVARIFDREKKAKAVGELVGLSAARVAAMRKAHTNDGEEASGPDVGASAEDGSVDAVVDSSAEDDTVVASVDDGISERVEVGVSGGVV